jgi:hypothetical protein
VDTHTLSHGLQPADNTHHRIPERVDDRSNSLDPADLRHSKGPNRYNMTLFASRVDFAAGRYGRGNRIGALGERRHRSRQNALGAGWMRIGRGTTCSSRSRGERVNEGQDLQGRKGLEGGRRVREQNESCRGPCVCDGTVGCTR